MSFDLVIRGGQLADGLITDIGIEGGKITQLGDLGGAKAAETFDARHLLAIPGLIDTQVHFREPGLEHKEDLESGTRSALHGGVTSILEMPNTDPATTSEEALKDKLARASGRAWCNYGFFIGATKENTHELARLERLPGVPGIKIFMGSSSGPLLVDDDESLLEVLKNGRGRVPVHAEDEARNRERKGLISDHPSPAEHPFLRDAESARLATERILRLGRIAERPVHILHVSTADELPLIEAAKREGPAVTAEVTPQHLWFTAPACYERLGTLAQMNPPIRSREHNEALWTALGEGLFDVFGSDHAPHTLEEKAKPYPQSPSGMPGVQTMLPVLMTFVSQGRLPLEQMVLMACEAPARLYGMTGKGRIQAGYDADLVLVDPNRSRVFKRSMVQTKCGWSPYEGETLTGWPEVVILGGQVAIRNEERLAGPSGRKLEFGG